MPRGTPLSTALFRSRGLTAKQVARPSEAGWLKRLGHGVYLLPGDELDLHATLVWLAGIVPGLHVAGKTALNWRGVRHNLAFREVLVLRGDKPATLPMWLTTAFPARYQAIHLFDDEIQAMSGLSPLPGGRPDLLVFTPERAVLELLNDVGKGQGLEEASHLVEGARVMRTHVLKELLSHLTRIKVVRLDLPWKAIARKHNKRLGGGRRWVSTTKTGERLNLKRPD